MQRPIRFLCPELSPSPILRRGCVSGVPFGWDARLPGIAPDWQGPPAQPVSLTCRWQILAHPVSVPTESGCGRLGHRASTLANFERKKGIAKWRRIHPQGRPSSKYQEIFACRLFVGACEKEEFSSFQSFSRIPRGAGLDIKLYYEQGCQLN